MFKEFRAFILRGNVVDLAIGVVIGAAFTSVVTALVTGVFTPLVGIFGQPDFKNLTITIHEATRNAAGEVVTPPTEIRYGDFLNALISFVVVAAVVFFLVVKPVNHLMEMRKAGEPEPEATTRECPKCLSKIPIKATRCAFCTSTLTPEKAEAKS